jgi:hypothetical protein
MSRQEASGDSRGKRHRKRPWRMKDEATVKKLVRKIRRVGALKM